MDTITRPRSTPPRKPGTSCLVRAIEAVLAPVVLVAGYAAWANWLPAAESDRRPRPNPNAFDRCVTAASGLKPLTGKHDLTRAPLPFVRKQIARRKPHLDAIRASFAVPYLTPPTHDVIDKTPYFAGFREAARDFAAEARLALADGNASECMNHSLDAVEFGSRVGWGGVAAQGVLELDVISQGLGSAERGVPRLSAAEARRAGERLDRIRSAACGLEEVLRGDRLMILTTVREMARNQMSVGTNPDGSDWGLGPLYPKRHMYLAVNQMYQNLLREAAKPYPARVLAPYPTEVMSRNIFPAYPPIMLRFTCAEACLRLLRIELALQEYRCKNGAFPERLSQIGEGLPASALTDPFSERSLIYRRRGAGYLLYSVGPNGQDEGGTPLAPGKLRGEMSGDLVAGRLAGRL